MNKKTDFGMIIAKIISFTTILLTFILFLYIDLESLTIWTTNIWDCIFDTGSIFNYYEYSAQNYHGITHVLVGSDIFVYLPWAIWNIPIWAIQRFSHISIIETPVLMLYSKLFLVVCFIATMMLSKKICKLLKLEDENNLLIYLSTSSIWTISAICYAGQNDILVILVFVTAFYFLLREKIWIFVLLSGISIAFKPYYIFAFILLILLYEKNIVKLSVKIVAGLIPYVLQKIIFWKAPMYLESLSNGPTTGELQKFFDFLVNMQPTAISVFVFLFLTLCILAYFYDIQDLEEKQKISIYYIVSSFVIMFLATRVMYYRFVYIIPFLYILFLMKSKKCWINMLFEMMFSGSMIYFFMTYDNWFYSPVFMKMVEGSESKWSLLDYIYSVGKYGEIPQHIFTNVFFVFSMIGILVVNHPRFKYTNKIMEKKPSGMMYLVRSLIYSIPLISVLTVMMIQIIFHVSL